MKRSTAEIEAIRKACRVTDATFKHILPHLVENVTEKAIVKKINKYIRRHSDGLAFKTIAAFGENSAEIHHQFPTERKLKKGDIIMLDFGTKINGLCSDMTRTLFFGKASTEQKRMYDTVLQAQQKAIEQLNNLAIEQSVIKIRALDIDITARGYILSKGYPAFPHGLGHGIGRRVHMAPLLSPKSKAYLKSGMVFSVEPGIYIQDFGGVRIEDLILLNGNKVEILTKSPKKLIWL